MPDWSIKIVSAEDGEGAAFVPDLKGAQPGPGTGQRRGQRPATAAAGDAPEAARVL